MKLDMDMVRSILETQEADTRYEEPIHAFGKEESAHYRLLVEAGFVRSTGKMPHDYAVGLTWEGHQLLADLRRKGVWSKLKSLSPSLLATIAKLASLAEQHGSGGGGQTGLGL